jgi:guanylate kinase
MGHSAKPVAAPIDARDDSRQGARMAEMLDEGLHDDSAHRSGFRRRGVLFVLSSPSGAGKSTISRMLLQDDPGLTMSVSATTRPRRSGEVDGRDYHFVDLARFKQMVIDHEFLEWAHVFDHRYGTPKAAVDAMLEAGQDVLFDIDWQGAQQLYQVHGADIVRVFILPPSMAELERRLRDRRTDSDAVIERRMARAHAEIAHWDGYDYVLVNDDVQACFENVRIILHAERLKRSRQKDLIGFIRRLNTQGS